MKLILTTGVEHLGAPGDIVEVKDGYGRNFLIPQGHAIRWTRGGESQITDIKRAKAAKEIRGIDHAKEVRTALEGLSVELPVRASEAGKLFGSVTPAEIAVAIKKAGGPAIEKRSITIPKPIKNLGNYQVQIALHDAVKAHLSIQVVAAK